MNEKKNDVWYKLRFTIGGLYLVLVFWWIAWSSLIAWSFMENTNSAAFEILEALVYLGFFIWILSFYKREYQSTRLNLSSSRRQDKNQTKARDKTATQPPTQNLNQP